MTTFTVANEDTLAQAIAQSRERLLYAAPGITPLIVAALREMLARPHPPLLTVIIDADPEVCRLGYGTVEGLTALQALANDQMLPIRYQPGLRLGVLVADAQMWVYAPTPLLIEAGAQRTDQPNGLVLGAADALLGVLMACAADGTPAAADTLPTLAEVGAQAATPELMRQSLQELERLPPKPFNVARTERVYNTRVQYVDLEVTGYKLAARRVQIPTDLLVGTDATLQARLRNSFLLLNGKDSLVVKIDDADPATGGPQWDIHGQAVQVDYSEARIEAERKQIYTDFLTTVPGHGQLISKGRRIQFDQRIEWFRGRVDDYAKGVKDVLDRAIADSITELTTSLLPGVMKRPPPRLLKQSVSVQPTEAEVRAAIEAELANAFKAGDRFFQPVVKVTFKDLTYETITDPKFAEQLKQSFPGLSQQGLFDEHDAAPEFALPGQPAATFR